MSTFQITFQNVLLALIYMVPGFIVSKMGKVKSEHLSGLSTVLIYICAPCMVMYSMMNLELTKENLIRMGLFFVVSLTVQIAFLLILYGILHKKYNDSKYRLTTICAIAGNVGFFGLPVVKAIMPHNPEVMCYSSIYVVTMNIIVFTVGVFCLTNNKKYMSLKSALINPSVFGFVCALILFFTKSSIWMPDIIENGITLVGGMTTPLCMMILGMRLAMVEFKKLFERPTVYLVCFLKLTAFPLFAYACVYFLPLDSAFKASVLVLSATPCASVVFNLAEIHKSETELSANCVMLSTILCIIVLPILTLIL